MRIAVAGEETLQAYHVGAGFRTDQYWATCPRFYQSDTAQDECADHALAELGLSNQQRPQALGRNENRFYVRLGNTVDQRRLAGQLSDFSEKLAGSLLDDGNDAPEPVAPVDGNNAGHDDEHAGTRLAG